MYNYYITSVSDDEQYELTFLGSNEKTIVNKQALDTQLRGNNIINFGNHLFFTAYELETEDERYLFAKDFTECYPLDVAGKYYLFVPTTKPHVMTFVLCANYGQDGPWTLHLLRKGNRGLTRDVKDSYQSHSFSAAKQKCMAINEYFRTHKFNTYKYRVMRLEDARNIIAEENKTAMESRW